MSKEHRDLQWMAIALEEARLAAAEGEVPIGAVLVHGDRLLARDHNRTIQLADPTAHAEIQVLRAAAREAGNYRLPGTEIFVTLEPCAMCAGALVWARVQSLVFGTRDEKAGAVGSRLDVLVPGLLNHRVQFREGIRLEECRQILREFFEKRRAAGASL